MVSIEGHVYRPRSNLTSICSRPRGLLYAARAGGTRAQRRNSNDALVNEAEKVLYTVYGCDVIYNFSVKASENGRVTKTPYNAFWRHGHLKHFGPLGRRVWFM